ncbi:hypothetical protein R1flu_027613 [Riccia fluitans]|uniref:Uncharacterized protein n=1 Tax=Riccia fluitans TaxID=41844 RepID=A0ABD1XJT1_9MARC
MREGPLQSGKDWGPKAFQLFSSVAPPQERHQILVHDIAVTWSMEDVGAALRKDNQELEIMERPRWLLKDLSNKKHSSILVSLHDTIVVDATAGHGLTLEGVMLRVSKFTPNLRPL